MIIGVDFDGTIVEHEYPEIGRPVPGAVEALARYVAAGHAIILWTMRSGEELQQAVDYLLGNGVDLYGVNENPAQKKWTSSPKAYCHIYIDDAAYGCPLVRPMNGRRPYVDWAKIEIGG